MFCERIRRVRRTSLARQSSSQKSSYGQSRQSEFSDSFHFLFIFLQVRSCALIKLKTSYRSKPSRKINVYFSEPKIRKAGVSKLRPVSSLCLRWLASVGGAASLAFARVLAFATSVARLATALALAVVLAFARVFTFFGIGHGLCRNARMARYARRVCTRGQ